MKNLALLFSIIVIASGICLAQTSGFTYQGKLGDGGAPANGIYQFECKLFDADTAGNQIGSTQTVVATVQSGGFTTRLDFGAAAFVAGQDRWLEVSVRLNGSGDAYTVLSPRQQVNSVPFAVRSLKATDADNATSLGGISSSSFVQTTDARLSDARTPTAGSTNYIQNTTAQQTSTNFNVSGDGTVGGTLNANAVNAGVQYNISGSRVLSNSGTANIFAGVGAGQSNTTGSFNAFFGEESGFRNVGGENNSFFGQGSGFSNNSGTTNSFFGGFSGALNTTGGHNTFIGAQSGSSNSVENNNTFIGAIADGAAGITNATAIGSNARVTQSNSLVLGSINGINDATADTNVGIGTTSPLFKLHVKTGTDQDLVVRPGADFSGSLTGIAFQSINDANSVYKPLDLEGSQITLNVGSGGNVGIGTTAPAFKLEVIDSSNTGLRVQTNTSGGAVASFGGFGAFQIDAENNRGGRFEIRQSGEISFGILGVAGNTQLCRNASNQISSCSSSLRYKTNIKPFSNGLNFITRLRPIAFSWKDGGMKDVGFGAEDVAKISPLLVTYNAKGEIEGVKYDRLSVIFVNAFKEQQTQIARQQKLIEKQQQQIDLLKQALCRANPDAAICKSN